MKVDKLSKCHSCGSRHFAEKTIRVVEVWGKWEAHLMRNCKCGRSWVLQHLPPGTAYVLGRQYGAIIFKAKLLKQYEGTAAFECAKRDRDA